MNRDLKRLAEDTFDILIVGGGVNGLATAWDAVLRGFQVALIDRGDFGAETSAGSLKIIHGGLRYLQHLDFRRMKQSIRERSTLMRIAPHLIRPMPFLVPTYGHAAQGRFAMAAASRVNDWVGAGRNKHLKPLGVPIPDGRTVTRAQVLDAVPGATARGLTGGVIFYDGQMINADRVTLSFGFSAAARGALLANYVEATGFIRDRNRIVGVHARDGVGRATFDIRARLVINMTGPWHQWVTGQLLDKPEENTFPLSKGLQIVIPARTRDMGYAFTSRHRDPDARVGRGGRHFFLAPWRGHSLIGTSDTLYHDHPDGFRITTDEITAFVEDINRAWPGAGIANQAVLHAFGGLQPVDPRRIGKGAQVAKQALLIDHRSIGGVQGLLTVIGVKYTACRSLAEWAVDHACRALGYERAECITARTPLIGGDVRHIAHLERSIREQAPTIVKPAVAVHLARAYGTQAGRLLTRIERNPDEARLLRGSNEIAVAHVRHAVEHEFAVHLSDVIMRRTDLGTLGEPDPESVEDCADIMAGMLDWDTTARTKEIEAVQALFPIRRHEHRASKQ